MKYKFVSPLTTRISVFSSSVARDLVTPQSRPSVVGHIGIRCMYNNGEYTTI